MVTRIPPFCMACLTQLVAANTQVLTCELSTQTSVEKTKPIRVAEPKAVYYGTAQSNKLLHNTAQFQ